jgi:PPIC-type PPIASE domain
MLAQLQPAGSKADISALGDSLMLDDEFKAVPASEVAKQFGEKFAAKLGELPTGQWQGPIESGFGVHLVLINERTEGRVPELEDVRAVVHREWANARRMEANEKFYQTLLRRYTVTIERPQVAKNTETEKTMSEIIDALARNK